MIPQHQLAAQRATKLRDLRVVQSTCAAVGRRRTCRHVVGFSIGVFKGISLTVMLETHPTWEMSISHSPSGGLLERLARSDARGRRQYSVID